MRLRWTARSVIWSAVLIAGMVGIEERVTAQSLPVCQPPRNNEYLLLVRNQKSETQNQLRQLLPGSAILTACTYFNDNVVRVEGFATADLANAWAKYLNDMAGLQATVARPSNATSSPAASSPANPAPTQPAASSPANSAPTQATSGGTSAPSVSPTPNPAPAERSTPAPFNPQPLGSGYAVVVNYFNRPEVAIDVQQVTARDVGLVAFEQRPYLLAVYTPDPAVASAVLRSLSDRGFIAAIVDSRRAVLLAPKVGR